MSTDIDWQHELDSSFGSGHDVATGQYVAAGRKAVRRRRRLTAVVVTASVVVGGSAVWAAAPDPTMRGDGPVATQPPSPEPEPDQRRDDDRDRATDRERPGSQPTMTVYEEFIGNPATIDQDGELKLSPLTDEVLERVPNPMGYGPAEGRSFGLRVIYRGVEKYSLVAGNLDGSSVSLNTNTATGDFASWLADKVSVQRSLDVYNRADAPDTSITETPEEWLALGPAGSIESASPFVAVMAVRDVDLGEGFAMEADRTGVARLQVAGSTELVAWRVVAGELEVVRGPGRFDSLDAFVDWARQQYASGEGMR